MPAGDRQVSRQDARGSDCRRPEEPGVWQQPVVMAGGISQCADAAAVSRFALLSLSSTLPAMAAPPCRRAGG